MANKLHGIGLVHRLAYSPILRPAYSAVLETFSGTSVGIRTTLLHTEMETRLLTVNKLSSSTFKGYRWKLYNICGLVSHLVLSSQKEEDKLLHCVAGVCWLAGCAGGDAVCSDRADHWTLAVRRDLLPGAHVSGRFVDNGVHLAPLLHRAGQVCVFVRDGFIGFPFRFLSLLYKTHILETKYDESHW